MLFGHKLSDLLQDSNLYPCSTTRGTDRYYIANEDVQGCDVRVKGYRQLEDEEKNECVKQIQSVQQLLPLLEFLSVN